MGSLEQVKSHLRRGQIYRRADLAMWSRSVDRHLAQFVSDGTLIKLQQGLYQYPKRSRFGTLPASPEKLVESFLKGDDFLLTSPNDYNCLGLGTTQLYNFYVVYNTKRHGRFELDGQNFEFRMKPRYPKKVTPEFLLVDLVNNLKQLVESHHLVLEKVKKKLPEMNSKRLQSMVKRFGKVATKKFFENELTNVI